MNTPYELIMAFGGAEPFAEALGIKEDAVRQMLCRNSIATKFWPRIIARAPACGVSGVTYDLLFSLERGRAARPADAPTRNRKPRSGGDNAVSPQ